MEATEPERQKGEIQGFPSVGGMMTEGAIR